MALKLEMLGIHEQIRRDTVNIFYTFLKATWNIYNALFSYNKYLYTKRSLAFFLFYI